jgi:hypothetical protein
MCRAVNVVFSDEFIHRLLSLKDRKGRREHETNNTYLEFWQRASDAHNTTSICLDVDVDEADVELVSTSKTGSNISASKPVSSVLLDDSTSEDESQNHDADAVAGTVSDNTNDVFATLVIPVGDSYLFCSSRRP